MGKASRGGGGVCDLQRAWFSFGRPKGGGLCGAVEKVRVKLLGSGEGGRKIPCHVREKKAVDIREPSTRRKHSVLGPKGVGLTSLWDESEDVE